MNLSILLPKQDANWTTFDGRKIKFEELDHQHLSNILWFNEVFRGINRYNSTLQFELGMELQRRFNGNRLPWKPLPIPNEINQLHRKGLIDKEGNIIGSRDTLSKEGQIIGSVTHIPNWQHL